MASELQKKGIQAAAYHAGLADSDRISVQEKWLYGDRCKVSTHMHMRMRTFEHWVFNRERANCLFLKQT